MLKKRDVRSFIGFDGFEKILSIHDEGMATITMKQTSRDDTLNLYIGRC